VVPIGNVLPDAGAQTTRGAASHTSLAVTSNATDAPAVLVQSRVRLPGHEIAGGVVSATVTLNEQLDAFVESSVALQLTVVAPNGKTLPDAGEQTTLGVASQTSVAVVENVTTAPLAPVHSRERLPEQVIAGGVVSRTVTTNEQLDVFDAASVAVHTTVALPKPNVLPDAGKHATAGAESHASVAVVVNVTAAPLGLVHSRTRLPEHVIAGGVVSTTVTVNVQLAAFDESSVAVQLTVVAPRGKVLPDAGAHEIVGVESHTSVALVVYVTDAPLGLVHSRIKFGEHVIAGGVVSCTLIANEHDDELPVASVAVQLTLAVPIANVLPDAGAHTTTGLGSHVSVAVVEYVTAAPLGLVHSRSRLGEHVITGGVESTRSRTKTSDTPFVSPATRLVATLE
jgi:hypothetical protein